MVHTHLKNRPSDGVQSGALGFDADSAIVLEHVLADVARDGHDGHIARLRLGQLGNAHDSQVVKPAMEARALESAAPCRPPSLHWPRGVNLPVLAPRKHIIARLDAGKAPSCSGARAFATSFRSRSMCTLPPRGSHRSYAFRTCRNAHISMFTVQSRRERYPRSSRQSRFGSAASHGRRART